MYAKFHISHARIDRFNLSLAAWDIGTEYLYDYTGLLKTALREFDNQSAVVQIVAKLTVQSIDDETLMLKVSDELGAAEKKIFLVEETF